MLRFIHDQSVVSVHERAKQILGRIQVSDSLQKGASRDIQEDNCEKKIISIQY